MAMTLVSTVTVGSGGAASIEFTNIPQTGKDLLVLCSLRTNNDPDSLGYGIYTLALNGSTSNQTRRRLQFGSSVQTFTSSDLVGVVSGSTVTANSFSNDSHIFTNYTSSADKAMSRESAYMASSGLAYVDIAAGRWANSSAITSVTFTPTPSGNFVQHSSISLYIIS